MRQALQTTFDFDAVFYTTELGTAEFEFFHKLPVR
jgi:hypothetical protein